MNAPAPAPRSKKAPVGVAVALALTLWVAEGREHIPYYDQAGILTVCGGITGKDVIKGKWYSWAECDVLEQQYIERMNEKIGHCVGAGLNPGEWIAWGHFTYNIGVTSFCSSNAAKLLRAGQYRAACDQMKRWVWLTKPGIGKVDCRIKANKCNGLPKRREIEHQWCVDAQTNGSFSG